MAFVDYNHSWQNAISSRNRSVHNFWGMACHIKYCRQFLPLAHKCVNGVHGCELDTSKEVPHIISTAGSKLVSLVCKKANYNFKEQ